MSPYLRIVGDIHGLVHSYAQFIQNDKCKYSIQIGDLGFNYEYLNMLDPECHKFIGGNHDNYDLYYSCQHALGDFGPATLGGIDFFFIRGAYSIDVRLRTLLERRNGHKLWWQQEQLSLKTMYEAYNSYVLSQPFLMISHSAPEFIAKLCGNDNVLRLHKHDPERFTTPTQQLLQSCFEIHQPNVWVFGHYHTEKVIIKDKTTFICLGSGQYIDIDENGCCSQHPNVRFKP